MYPEKRARCRYINVSGSLPPGDSHARRIVNSVRGGGRGHLRGSCGRGGPRTGARCATPAAVGQGRPQRIQGHRDRPRTRSSMVDGVPAGRFDARDRAGGPLAPDQGRLVAVHADRRRPSGAHRQPGGTVRHRPASEFRAEQHRLSDLCGGNRGGQWHAGCARPIRRQHAAGSAGDLQGAAPEGHGQPLRRAHGVPSGRHVRADASAKASSIARRHRTWHPTSARSSA